MAEEPPPKKKARAAPAPAPTVVLSDTYAGSVPGFVFKTGDQGTGYYIDGGGDGGDDEDDDGRFATWMGCTVVYIFLTKALYDELSKYLLPPHHSLNLCKAEVYDLILEAANDKENCKVVGDDEYLDAYLKSKDHFHCPKTWRDGSE